MGMAAGVVTLPPAAKAQAVTPTDNQCSVAGTTVTCTGDLSTGVDVDGPPHETLNVNNVDAPGITPAAGTGGVDFTATAAQDVTVDADTTGTPGITTSGDDTPGISARQNGGDGNVSVTSTGNIETMGDNAYGIVATQFGGNGDVSVVSNGDITVMGNEAMGIRAIQGGGNGDLSVTSNGNITTTVSEAIGISASRTGGNGAISITSNGNLNTMDNSAHGISAHNFGGDGAISVTSTGDIGTMGNFSTGISAQQDGGDGDITVISTGELTTTGNNANGIFAQQDGGNGDVTITSTGNITTTNGTAILADIGGDGNISVNSNGDITSNGNTGIEARVSGNGNTTINSNGNVTTDNIAIGAYTDGNGNHFISNTGNVMTDSLAIYSRLEGDGNTTIVSNGNLTTTGFSAVEIQSMGMGNVSFTSNGNITSGAGDAIQVDHSGAGANPGTIAINISGSVSGNTAINLRNRPVGTPATINTFGMITGTGGTAINLQDDSNDVVNLGGGTVITGFVDFGNGNDPILGPQNPNDIDTMNALPGFNGVVTFPDVPSMPENTSSNIALFNNGGTQTAVAIDPTGFAASGVFLGSFTNSIFNSLDNNGSAPQNGISTHGGAGPYAYGNGPRYWASGFGGFEAIEPGSSNAGIDHSFGGLMFGGESGFDNGTAGLFAGYGISDLDFQFGAGSTNIESIFGGGYYKQDYGSYRIHLALVGGTADHESVRNIPGVPATFANGDYDGWFISPAATFMAPIEALPVPTIGSIRVSYAGMWLDGYTETGTVALPFTISDREVHLLSTRAQLIFPNTIMNEDGGHTHAEFRIGADGQWDAGSSNVNAAVGGTAISFSADLDNQVAAFVGASVTRKNADESFALTVAGELLSTFDGGYEVSGELKASWKF